MGSTGNFDLTQQWHSYKYQRETDLILKKASDLLGKRCPTVTGNGQETRNYAKKTPKTFADFNAVILLDQYASSSSRAVAPTLRVMCAANIHVDDLVQFELL
eukprot:3022227-Amphidinium_carterae.1